MESIIREFFQNGIKCLTGMSVSFNEFFRIVFLHDKIKPLATKFNSWMSTSSEKYR